MISNARQYRDHSMWKITGVILSLSGFLITYWIGFSVFENIPHIEDEITYVWQARVIAQGKYIISSPECPDCFPVPFVIDHKGHRFGKYPLGWPVLLSFGYRVGNRNLIPPILTSFNLWLIYTLAVKLSKPKIAVICTILTLTSPFFLMNSSSFLAHGWSLLLTLIFIHGWIDSFTSIKKIHHHIPLLTAALALGILALTRPLTAIGIAIPFMLHACLLLINGDRAQRFKLLVFICIVGFLASLHFVWQHSLTGNALTNPYTFWWSYDRFGLGDTIGIQKGGFHLEHAIANTQYSLWIGQHDLFGWPYFSWIFFIPGVFAIKSKPIAWLPISIFPSLVVVYAFYWIGSWILGPRYYFEGFFSLSFISALGINAILEWTKLKYDRGFKFSKRVLVSLRFALSAILISGLFFCNVIYYLPWRLKGFLGYYGISASQTKPFTSTYVNSLTPALIIVHKYDSWKEYGSLIDIMSPFYDSPFVFSMSQGDNIDDRVIARFPERNVFHYYADNPYTFYKAPRR